MVYAASNSFGSETSVSYLVCLNERIQLGGERVMNVKGSSIDFVMLPLKNLILCIKVFYHLNKICLFPLKT